MNIRQAIKTNLLKLFGGMGYLTAGVTCRHEWYGGKYSGFFLHPDLLNERSVVYSFGIGEDISFDEAVIDRFGCRIYGFDPTPKTIRWLKNKPLPPGFHFEPVGIAAASGTMDFYLPKNPEFVSGSTHIHHELNENEKISVPVRTLPDIMSRLGHTHVDVLKMDIEGSEYEVIDSLLAAEVSFDQLLLEFHSRFFENGNAKTRATVAQLREHGYEVFAVSGSLQEVSFIRRELIS